MVFTIHHNKAGVYAHGYTLTKSASHHGSPWQPISFVHITLILKVFKVQTEIVLYG